MRVLITGNLGYLGPCVTRQIRQTFPGAGITGIDAGYFTACQLENSSSQEQPDQQSMADIRELPAGLFNGVDVVVHLAALSSRSVGKAFDAVTSDVNFGASMEIARRAKKAGAKSFVFASSCGVYGSSGDGSQDGDGTEKSEVNPTGIYLRSKIATEYGLRTLAGRDFTVTCIRFAAACGASPHLRLDAVLNHFVACAIARHEIRLMSDGNPWHQLMHVRDMARAIDWAIARPSANGGSFLVVNAGSDSWTWRAGELANAVAECLPGVAVTFNPGTPGVRSLLSARADFSLFRRLAPLHQPRMRLELAILEMQSVLERYFAANGTDFTRLNRLHVLSDLVEQGRLSPDLRWAQTPVPTAPATRYASA